MVDRTRIFWFGRTEPEPELKSPNPNRTRTEPVSNKIGTFTKVKQFFAGFSSKKLNGQASKAVINGCNKGNKYFLMWRFPISSEILGQFRHLLVENRIYVVFWFGSGSVDRTSWFGRTTEPHRTSEFGRTRTRTRTVRSTTTKSIFSAPPLDNILVWSVGLLNESKVASSKD